MKNLKMMKRYTNNSTLLITIFILHFVLLTKAYSTQPERLCDFPSCQCSTSNDQPQLIDVLCKCPEKQVLRIGSTINPNEGASIPPENTGQLIIDGCHHVEIFAKTLNNLPSIQNISLNNAHKVVIHHRIVDTRIYNGGSAQINNFEISNVRHLDVKRQGFEGISIKNSFTLKNVIMEQVPSLAFNFDSVNEFNIFGGQFTRISMWGIKLAKCREFNVVGNSYFISLATQAFVMKCKKFMSAYNVFGRIQTASLNITYGLADIQGNTFESIIGKPFVNLSPMPQNELNDVSESGFVFRENKFRMDPSLPFDALAMPHFEELNHESLIQIEDNHFVCDCNKMAWFIGLVEHGFNQHKIDPSSRDFAGYIYDSSGKCLECGLRECQPTEKNFLSFASSALIQSNDGESFACSSNPTLPILLKQPADDQTSKTNKNSGKSLTINDIFGKNKEEENEEENPLITDNNIDDEEGSEDETPEDSQLQSSAINYYLHNYLIILPSVLIIINRY